MSLPSCPSQYVEAVGVRVGVAPAGVTAVDADVALVAGQREDGLVDRLADVCQLHLAAAALGDDVDLFNGAAFDVQCVVLDVQLVQFGAGGGVERTALHRIHDGGVGQRVGPDDRSASTYRRNAGAAAAR